MGPGKAGRTGLGGDPTLHDFRPCDLYSSQLQHELHEGVPDSCTTDASRADSCNAQNSQGYQMHPKHLRATLINSNARMCRLCWKVACATDIPMQWTTG